MTSTNDRLPDAVRWLLSGRPDATSARCGCIGQCGRRHPMGSCDAAEPDGFTVAPSDLSIPVTQAAALPAELVVWCLSCRRLAEAAARRRRKDQAEHELATAQLGLWGAP